MRLREHTPPAIPPHLLRDPEARVPWPLIGWREQPALHVAPPTFQAAGASAGADGAGSNVTPAWPAHAVDDIALCQITQYNNGSSDPGAATLATANGFAQVTGASKLSSSGTRRVRVTVFWRRASSTSMSAPVVQGIAGSSLIAQIVTYRGCITTGNPWDVVSTSANDSADTALAATGATTTVADTLVAIIAGAHVNTGFSAWANSDLGSVTEQSDSGFNGGIGTNPLTAHIASATGTKAAAGAYGNTTATIATSATWAAITIALRPPATATFGNLLLLGVG